MTGMYKPRSIKEDITKERSAPLTFRGVKISSPLVTVKGSQSLILAITVAAVGFP